MTTPVRHHEEHNHRYAHSHHPHHFDAEELKLVPRNEATKCEHRFMHVADCDKTDTTETVAVLIAHLEEHSLKWVTEYTQRINGQNGGLNQKFIFKLAKPLNSTARSNKNTAISILEEFGR